MNYFKPSIHDFHTGITWVYLGGGWVYHLFIYLFISAGAIEW